jgi:hypothetical protein
MNNIILQKSSKVHPQIYARERKVGESTSMRRESRRDKEFRVQTDQAHEKWQLKMMNIDALGQKGSHP